MAMEELEIASSSMIDGAKYDDETGELQLTFANGSVYSCTPAPSIVDGLKSASSPGRFWNEVKSGIACSRVG